MIQMSAGLSKSHVPFGSRLMQGIAILLVVGCAMGDLSDGWMKDINQLDFFDDVKLPEASLASIRYKYSFPGHLCTGSILTENYVLTVAHCCLVIEDPFDFFVFTGSPSQNFGGIESVIGNLIIHEEFNTFADASDTASMMKNDICLINLLLPLVFNELTQPIALSPRVREILPVTVLGWADSDFFSDFGESKGIQVNNDIIVRNRKTCDDGMNGEFSKEFFCISGRLTDEPQNFDSGSIVMDQNAQIGMVSFAFVTEYENMPSACVRLSNYLDWIKMNLGDDAGKLIVTKPEVPEKTSKKTPSSKSTKTAKIRKT